MMSCTPSRPDFTGLWEVDFEKSTMRGERPQQILMKINHREPRLTQTILVIQATGAEQRLTFTYETTGEETVHAVGGGGWSRAHWEDEDVVIESSMKTSEREFHFKDHWSLSGDGQTLTMAHRDDDLTGQISVLEKASQAAATRFDKL